MEKELDPVVIKATQTSLGKYVKRPPLSEKLLKKPPFRFLHDIVTSVLKTTGFFQGLFEDEELISDNVKDRESKILFLNKVIAVVGLTTGKPLLVKSSKIVAGQEPDKTNELLQCLALALDKKLSSDDAVQKFKQGISSSIKSDDKKPKESAKPVKKAVDSNKLTSKSSERLTNHKKDPNLRSLSKNDNDKTVNKSKQKDKSHNKSESPPKRPAKTISKKPSVEKNLPEVNNRNADLNNVISENEFINSNPINEDASEKPKHNELGTSFSVNTDETELLEPIEQNLNSSYTIADNLNSSLSSQDLIEKENDKETGNLVRDTNVNVEESSLDCRDSKEKENNNSDIHRESDTTSLTVDKKSDSKHEALTKSEPHTEIAPTKDKNIVRPFSVRPSSSRPGAPRLRDKHENVLSETDNIMLVGKVNIIVENAPNEEEEDTSIIIVDQGADGSTTAQDEQEPLQASLSQHGHLVQQILDSQKEYSQLSGKTEIEWEFGAQKARDAINKEIEQLRFDIQALSRAANPLGKLLDHVQEDVETMRQELQQWTKTYEEASKELSKQKTANEDSLFPLTIKLKQLDADIMEKHDKINDLKMILYKNSFRIEKLLANGHVQ